MYNIKQASIRSGVSVPLIRAWERRYGVVHPKRSQSGYRLYDEQAIATLARVRELTDAGWSPSEASRAVLAGEVEVSLPSPVPLANEPQDIPSARRKELIDRFVSASAATDMSATCGSLDEMLALGSFESVVDDLLMPALEALGQAWASGELDIAAEHAASAAVQRRLSALYEAAAASGPARVVVGLPPGARHELGVLAFAVALRRLGMGVLYVGADLPVASWVHVVDAQRARLAVLAVVQAQERAAVLEVVTALRATKSRPIVAIGGRSSRWERAPEAGIVVLPERIIDAARVAAGLASGTISTGQDKGALR